jgi:hypothetical protein
MRWPVEVSRYALAATMLATLLSGCATGSAIVTGVTRPPIAVELVKLYSEPPAKFEVIAVVKASSSSGWTEQGSVDYAIAELRKQAAKLGANGVLLETSGTKTSTVVGSASGGMFYAIPVDAEVVTGRAIFAP